jgi:hypothetical protein
MNLMKNALYGLLIIATFTPKVHADPSPDSIRTAMDAAEAHLEKQKAKHELHNTHTLTPEAANLGLALPPQPATYKPGDQWNIVGYQELPLGSPSNSAFSGRSAAFHFEVTSVDDENIRVRVTPIAAYGLRNIDPRVQYADFT